jgi:hypothetical protein
MQGWIDAIPYIKTKYSMLLHNDGYALDSFFGCELLQALRPSCPSRPPNPPRTHTSPHTILVRNTTQHRRRAPLPHRHHSVVPVRLSLGLMPHPHTIFARLAHAPSWEWIIDILSTHCTQALKNRQETQPEANYFLAAPMLYESKMDGSLAAHATQTNLRLVKDNTELGVTVHHDHSLRRALNRGNDFKEAEQKEFVEVSVGRVGQHLAAAAILNHAIVHCPHHNRHCHRHHFRHCCHQPPHALDSHPSAARTTAF